MVLVSGSTPLSVDSLSSAPVSGVVVVDARVTEVVDVAGIVLEEGDDTPPHADATTVRASTADTRLRCTLTLMILLPTVVCDRDTLAAA
jgi:hypothetical protein